jgi:hypothetical protein
VRENLIAKKIVAQNAVEELEQNAVEELEQGVVEENDRAKCG